MMGALAAAFAVLFYTIRALRCGLIPKGHGSVETLDRISVGLVDIPDVDRSIWWSENIAIDGFIRITCGLLVEQP